MTTASRVRRTLICALVTASMVPAGASAQEEGVTVDPESPTGKEYALPIDRARREADPTQKPGKSMKPGSPAPLFGAGVGDVRGGRTSSPGGGSGGGKAGRSDTESSQARAGGARTSGLPRSEDVARFATSDPSRTGGFPPTLLFGGGGAILLATGAAVGFALRRRSS